MRVLPLLLLTGCYYLSEKDIDARFPDPARR